MVVVGYGNGCGHSVLYSVGGLYSGVLYRVFKGIVELVCDMVILQCPVTNAHVGPR